MNATESPTPERRRSPGRRVLLVAAPFAAGAVAAAGVLTAVGVTGSSSPSQAASSLSARSSAATIASTQTTLDAATIYERANPGVVDITVTQSSQGGSVSPFVPGGSQQSEAEGSGYVYDESGHIVTAEHVVEGASAITVRFSDGSKAKATLVGTDPSTDTAVIKVSVPASKLTPLALADSSKVEPGQGVVAIGSPFGLTESITAGIVSAVDRTIEAPNGYSISSTIQTDAPINHGNSGGPLIDATGKVIGTNVQIAVGDQATSSTNAGVGFAVPSNTVKTVVQDLIAGKAVQHAYLGVSVGDATSGSGALVGTVRSGSPAATAGLKAGDVIVAVDGDAISGASDLTAAVAAHEPGDTIQLTVKRNGSTTNLTVKLGTRPASTTA